MSLEDSLENSLEVIVSADNYTEIDRLYDTIINELCSRDKLRLIHEEGRYKEFSNEYGSITIDPNDDFDKLKIEATGDFRAILDDYIKSTIELVDGNFYFNQAGSGNYKAVTFNEEDVRERMY